MYVIHAHTYYVCMCMHVHANARHGSRQSLWQEQMHLALATQSLWQVHMPLALATRSPDSVYTHLALAIQSFGQQLLVPAWKVAWLHHFLGISKCRNTIAQLQGCCRAVQQCALGSVLHTSQLLTLNKP